MTDSSAGKENKYEPGAIRKSSRKKNMRLCQKVHYSQPKRESSGQRCNILSNNMNNDSIGL